MEPSPSISPVHLAHLVLVAGIVLLAHGSLQQARTAGFSEQVLFARQGSPTCTHNPPSRALGRYRSSRSCTQERRTEEPTRFGEEPEFHNDYKNF